MSNFPTLSRRRFLQTAAIAAAPLFIPSRAWGANDRIVVGFIGLGNQGGGNLSRFLKRPDVVVGGLCDVDSSHLAKAVKKVEATGITPKTYGDYRELLDDKRIDAVVISTPDHWHALPTIHACQAKKDVYCEKPLTLTIREGRRMVEAARENQRVVQTGSQQRSGNEFRQACELVRNGRIGKIERVLVGIEKPNHPGEPVPDSDPPAELDYDFWLGPAPQRPYNQKRVHYNFRFFRDYSGGQMTNWGAHHLDIAQWGLGRDDSGPVKIEGTGTFHPEGWHEVTETCRVTLTYDDGVTVIVGQGQEDIPSGTTFIGTEGQIFVNRGKLRVQPEELAKQPLDEGAIRLYQSSDHVGNFLDCIRSREKPAADVEIGHRSATACHLANLAIDLKRPLQWDPATESFASDSEANDRLETPYRGPWSLS